MCVLVRAASQDPFVFLYGCTSSLLEVKTFIHLAHFWGVLNGLMLPLMVVTGTTFFIFNICDVYGAVG